MLLAGETPAFPAKTVDAPLPRAAPPGVLLSRTFGVGLKAIMQGCGCRGGGEARFLGLLEAGPNLGEAIEKLCQAKNPCGEILPYDLSRWKHVRNDPRITRITRMGIIPQG